MTTKLDLQKLAPTLTGKERAKLLITSWHEAIIGKQTFSEADTKALVYFDESKLSDGRECRYYMTLYKHGYFMLKSAIEEVFLKIVALTVQLHHFHKALGIDSTLRLALRAITGVPTFITEAEFKQKRDEELARRIESVAHLANDETNALLEQQGFFEEKNKWDFWLDKWQPNSTMAEIEAAFGWEWIKTFWQQVERIRSLIQGGKLNPATLPEREQRYAPVTITGVADGVITKSWYEFTGRHNKNYQPYLETDELYAISYNPDEVDHTGQPLELNMRKSASDLCQQLAVVSRNYSNGLEKLSINEHSPLLEQPQETLRALEQQMQMLETNKAAVETLESDLHLPLFDDKSYTQMNEQYEQATKAIAAYNEFIEHLEKPDNPYIKIELTNKDKYLLKTLPILTETKDQLVKDIKDIAEHETSLFYR